MSEAFVWNEARDALLRQLVADGVRRGDCVTPLAKLPGAPITKTRQVAYRMFVLGLTLSGERRSAVWSENIRLRCVLTWTAERLAYLDAAYPIGTTPAEMLAKLNAMEGPPVASWEALVAHANKRGLKRAHRKLDPDAPARKKEQKRIAAQRYRERKRAEGGGIKRVRKPVVRPVMVRPVAPPPPPPEPIILPEPSPEIADAVTESRYARVKAAVRRDGSNAQALSVAHGLPLREVYRLMGERRREMRA